MSRVRRLLATRTLLSRVERLEVSLRSLNDALAARQQFIDPVDSVLAGHEQRMQLLERERLHRSLHVGGGAAGEVERADQVPSTVSAPYLCVADDDVRFHERWFDVATTILAVDQEAIAVYGAHLHRVGAQLVWQFSDRLAHGEVGAETPSSAVVLRAPAPDSLTGLSGSGLVAALATAGKVLAVPHPASVDPNIFERS